MQSNYSCYDYKKSIERIDEILNTKGDFTTQKSIPSRDKLTFNNGLYVSCSVLYVDIRDSSKLPDKYQKPTLSKIYRSYISETVAIINDNPKCMEINIEGDCVWGIFDTPYQDDINEVFYTSAKISSLCNILNYKLSKKNIDPIEIGIGLSYDSALMIKAGYKGSGINDLVWMGDAVNEACKLCNEASKNYDDRFNVSAVFYDNLIDHNKKLLQKSLFGDSYYTGNIVNTTMAEWLNEKS